jgi:hypothetical protein
MPLKTNRSLVSGFSYEIISFNRLKTDDMNEKDEKLMRKMERESIEHLKQEKVC